MGPLDWDEWALYSNIIVFWGGHSFKCNSKNPMADSRQLTGDPGPLVTCTAPTAPHDERGNDYIAPFHINGRLYSLRGIRTGADFLINEQRDQLRQIKMFLFDKFTLHA